MDLFRSGDMGRLSIIILVILTTYVAEASSGQWLNKVSNFAERLDAELQKIFQKNSEYDTLAKKINELMSSSLVTTESIDGMAIVDQLSIKLSDYFFKRIEAVERIVNKAETIVAEYEYQADDRDGSIHYVDMRNPDNETEFQYDARFNTSVNFNTSGIHVPIEVYQGHPIIQNAINWSVALDEVFQENVKKLPSILWQYVGSNTGVLRLYPAAPWKEDIEEIPDLYDARRRSWYVQSATFPKEMLIMMDMSGSIHGLPLEIMKLAVKTLLNTLDENDYVNVAWFSNKRGWISCLESFVPANSINKMILYEAIDDLLANEMADYAKALEFAFTEFEKADIMKFESNETDCERVIMFFTDGTDEDPESTVLKYNKDKQVRIFTYGVGPESLLIHSIVKMACNNRGRFTALPAKTAIRTQTQEYVNVLSDSMALSGERFYRWTTYYWDILDIGMIISVTYPIFNRSISELNQSMVGVAGIDITVEDLVNNFPDPLISPFEYFFIINVDGYIVYHPNMKTEGGYLDDSSMEDLLDMEGNSTEFHDLRKHMMDRETGNRTIYSMELDPHQNYTLPYRKTYFYTFIAHTPFSIAFVFPAFKKMNVKFSDINTHRELELPPSKYSVAPRKYCNGEITDNVVVLNAQMKNMRNCNEKMIQRVMWDIKITKILPDMPTPRKQNSLQLISSFLVTEGGLAKVNKPTLIEPNFPEAWLFPYYKKAAIFNNSWIISSNVLEGENETFIEITGLKSVLYNGIKGEQIPAVVGVKFVGNLLDETTWFSKEENVCNSTDLICYLIDDSGYVVAANNNRTEDITKFLGDIDYEIMWNLHKEKIFLRKPVYNFQNVCPDEEDATDDASHMPHSIINSILFEFNYQNVMNFMSMLYLKFNVWSWFQSLWIKETDALFEFGTGIKHTKHCVTVEYFYHFGNKTETNIQIDLYNGSITRKISCRRLLATNLLLIIAEEPTELDFNDKTLNRDLNEVSHDTLCKRPFRYDRQPRVCHPIHIEEGPRVCSRTTALLPSIIVITIIFLLQRIS